MLKDYPDDWCALLKEVPASSVGSKEGSNYICIGRHSSKFNINYLEIKFYISIHVDFKLY